MPTRIALLRGINVGGNNPLPMKSLVSILEGLGCEDVATYIQCGNAVFRSRHRSGEALGKAIGEAIAAERGFHPTTFVIDVAALRRIAEANPYPEAEAEPKSLHVWLLAGKPGPGARQKLEALRSGSESFHLVPGALFLHAPGGIGRSKLAAGAERALGRQATARNWRTVTKLLEMAEAIG
jgi:uncharacterized protein (DUF1697 family)